MAKTDWHTRGIRKELRPRRHIDRIAIATGAAGHASQESCNWRASRAVSGTVRESGQIDRMANSKDQQEWGAGGRASGRVGGDRERHRRMPTAARTQLGMIVCWTAVLRPGTNPERSFERPAQCGRAHGGIPERRGRGPYRHVSRLRREALAHLPVGESDRISCARWKS